MSASRGWVLVLAALAGALGACGGGGSSEVWDEATLELTWTIDGGPAADGCGTGVTIGVVNLSLPARAPDAADDVAVLCREGAGTFVVNVMPGSNRIFVDAKGDVGAARLLSGEHEVTFVDGRATLSVDLRHGGATPDAGAPDARAPDASAVDSAATDAPADAGA